MAINTQGGLPNNAYGLPIVAQISPVTGNPASALGAPGAPGTASVETETQKATYSYATGSFTVAATPTDILQIAGSSSVVVRIKRIAVSGIATAPGTLPIALVRRSTAPVGGTSTAPTILKHDISSTTASAVVRLWTANIDGGLGTTTGTIHNGRVVTASTVGVTSPGQFLAWDFTNRNDQALVLRGATDIVAISGVGATVPAGGSFDFDIEWTEEPVNT